MPAITAPYEVLARDIANGTGLPLQVVCAWPVSSQYGAGSRFLYYVLLATCVFLRKAEWLRSACLAAALLVPSIGALHGIVLASYHVNGAVDLDIFGAWQLCSIAIIAVPSTLRISRTYFNEAGRNIIFLWTVLLISGLIAMCVEFSRVTSTDCSHDDAGVPSLTVAGFPYGKTICNLTCSEKDGPFSRMRGGAANNIYVIPVPGVLTFNAAMLIAAGVCIPAILSLIFTWEKILEIHWKTDQENLHEIPEETQEQDEHMDSVKLTSGQIKTINNTVTRFLSVIEIPLFGGAVLAILIAGEINFFSAQMMYQTEPMASIGQWSPIAGTCMAALGSMYLYWTMGEDIVTFGNQKAQKAISVDSGLNDRTSRSRERTSEEPSSPTRAMSDIELALQPSSEPNALGLIPTITTQDPEQNSIQHIECVSGGLGHPLETNSKFSTKPNAGRSRIRNWLENTTKSMSETAHRELDPEGYKNKKAYKYPIFPGEELKNKDLHHTSKTYSEMKVRKAASVRSAQGGESPPIPPSEVQLRPDASPDAITPIARQATLQVPEVAHRSPRLGMYQGAT